MLCVLKYSKYIDVTWEPSQHIHSLGVLFKLHKVTACCGSFKKVSHVFNLKIYGKEYPFILITFTSLKISAPHSQ